VIGKTSDDADAPFKRRDFATVAFADDRVKNALKLDLNWSSVTQPSHMASLVGSGPVGERARVSAKA
jgi:hypothetical protein